MEHTPLRLREAAEHNHMGNAIDWIVDNEGNIVCRVGDGTHTSHRDKTRAAEIVQAVNSHDELVAALSGNLNLLRGLPLSKQGSTIELRIAKAIEKTREAISNATKEGK